MAQQVMKIGGYLAGAFAALVLALTGFAHAQDDEASPYARWSALVIAADNKASNGGTTEAFDNARKAITENLVRLGFDPAHIRQFSADKAQAEDRDVKRTSLLRMRRDLALIKNRTPEGCFFYITTHGDPEGLVFGNDTLTAEEFWSVVERLCAEQPTIAIISACFSGTFATEEWHRRDRFIATAARPDRTSFGCGADDIYPFFDACFLDAMQDSATWIDAAEQTRTCVAKREVAEGLEPPSEPQIFVGEDIRLLIDALPVGMPSDHETFSTGSD